MKLKKMNNLVYEVKPFRNFREMLDGCAEDFADRVAVLFSDGAGGVRRVRYSELAADVEALSTYLSTLGLSGKKVGVIGKNSYVWMITYLAVTCGTAGLYLIRAKLTSILTPGDAQSPPGTKATALTE